MPRPRFENLDPERKQGIIDAAAQEISEQGIANASLNRILQRAGLSKGSAYYYFDDREDLLATVLDAKMREAVGGFSTFDTDHLTVGDFWDELKRQTLEMADPTRWDPWLLGVLRALWDLPAERRFEGAMGEVYAEMSGFMERLIVRGQQLGLIRTSLPNEVLVAMTMAVGESLDRWMLERFSDLTPEEIHDFTDEAFAAMRRLLTVDDTPSPTRSDR